MVKKMKKEIIVQPYLKDMTYDEDSWLIIDCRTGDEPHVSFYNAKQDKEKEFETLQDFAQAYIENEFAKFDDAQTEYKEKTVTASGCNVTEGDDYDEDSRRSWKTLDPSGQLIEVMQGIKLENINDTIKKVSKDLSNIESEATDNEKDAADERRDPYAYRGLNKRDFM